MRNRNRSHVGLSWLIALMGLLAVPTALAETAETAFVRLAGKIPFVNYSDLFYQRTPRRIPDDPRMETATAGLHEAMSVPGDLDVFARLAEHSDPRVRMLALIRLYCMEQPEAFIAIQRRMGDNGDAFPYQSDPCGMIPGEKVPVVTESRTVGSWATWMMEQVDFRGHSQQDFDRWKVGRIGNPDWIRWYDFLYQRASGRTSPVPAESIPRVEALKKRMESASPAVRAWFWFGLADDALSIPSYDTAVATKAEMLAAGKQLGPEALLAFLRDGSRAGLRESKVDDPQRGRRFILSNGGKLFRTEDAASLAAMDHFVTAADANPAMASRLIREGIAKTKGSFDSWDRARAVAALMDLRGDEEAEFVVKWFYEAPVIASQSSDQGVFLTELLRREPKQWRRTLHQIVAHPGFEKLSGLDVCYTAILVNQLSGEKVVPEEMRVSGWDHETRDLLRKYFGLPAVDHQRLGPVANPDRKPLWSTGFDTRVQSMAISPDGRIIALGMQQGGVRLIDRLTGRDMGVLEMKGWQPVIGFRKADGRLLVVDSGALTEWDLPERRVVSQFKPQSHFWSECAIHPSGNCIADRRAGGDDCGVAIYDLPGGNQRWLFPLRIRGGGSIIFSNEGDRLATGDGFSHDVYLFDSRSATPIAKLTGHSDVPAASCFSPDGRWLATLGGGKILLWDSRTGELLNQFLSRSASSLCFTADSQAFVTCSDFNQMTRYEVKSGKALSGYEIKAGYISEALAADDGKLLYMVREEAQNHNSLECWVVGTPE